MRTVLKVAVMAGLLALAGCASKVTQPEQYSGFLKDYSNLQQTTSASGKPVFIASSIIIIFICIAVILLGYAFGALNRHRFDSKKNNIDKQELDTILKLYNINYDFKITFKDRMLMPTDIKTELKIKKPQSLDV